MIFGMTLEQYNEWMQRISASQRPSMTTQPVRTARTETSKLPHDQLDVDGWVRLVRELGYWDHDTTVEEFWDRVATWNASVVAQQEASSQTSPTTGAQPESLSGASSPQMPSPSDSSPSAPERGSSSPAVPPGGVDPDWVLG